jgi:hypothetical protein
MNKFYISLIFILFAQKTLAQDKYSISPFDVKSTTEKIKIDGILDEKVWQGKENAGNFWQYFPSDTLRAEQKTQVYITFDDKNIYVAAKCASNGKKYVIPSNRRDYRAGGSDNISFIFDTFNDKTNAFLFGLNPFGIMREGVISNGGQDVTSFNFFWDNKWQGTSKILDDSWVCEMAIPFSTLRFKEGTTHWNFMCYRFDSQSNEQSSYVRVPQNQVIFNLAFMGRMDFEKPLKKSGSNISLIPYLAGSSLRDFEKNNPSSGDRITYGGDAKIGITSGLNLDLTINPDFSNVEADQQVTNLTRFDITYPEKRQFFLENSDLFTNFGSSGISPFFSRRMGIARDSTSGLNIQNAINYGARISGKLDDNWRVGLMRVQTAEDRFKGISATDFTVGAVQRKVLSRSNISFIFVDKTVRNPEINKKVAAYNRVAGLEYNLASEDNKWFGKFFYQQSFSPDNQTDKFANGSLLNYSDLRYQITWKHDWVGKGYNAEVGFVPRNDYWRITPSALLSYYPNTKILNKHTFGILHDQSNVPDYGITDRTTSLFWAFSFQDNSQLSLSLQNNYSYLYNYEFNPLLSRDDKATLPEGAKYNYNNLALDYISDSRKKIFLRTTAIIGDYYDGSIINIDGALSYRYQPYGSLTLNMTYNDIKNKAGLQNKIYLVGPKFDFTFTKNLFWTTFVQYNSQFDNLNINSRFQWRFAPVSDFFLVYTDNYNTFDNLNLAKNRAVFAKITYWFSL